MLKYKVGDLIVAAKAGEVDIIAHGCNCFNTMKSGIAPLIAKAFPEAWAADQATKKGGDGKLGSYSWARCQKNLMVFNLYTQYDFKGRYKGKREFDYGAANNAFCKLKEWADMQMDFFGDSKDDLRFGFPKIGAGLAMGNWETISGIIDQHLGDYDVTIYTLK